ncbi:Hsp70 family protein [Polymorphobacter multimanifer]|uniref:Hsp70 family protein n=1 Tax=Polymorphobacter multimanifer TaxID=1070431 RepID=UPI00160AEED7|nr:Hsp70 family protein [Polymorphobacter multimanifer]
MPRASSHRTVGVDFGTTNTVVAVSQPGEDPRLLDFSAPVSTVDVFRSALCFWEDDTASSGVAVEAGPWAIAEYLSYPAGCRFIQSFKSVAASSNFDRAAIFEQRYTFEALGRAFLGELTKHAGGELDDRGSRIVVGRPVAYAGGSPDPPLARQRYDLMFNGFGAEIHYVYEPLAAAFTYAARLTDEATVLVADFGGGTSDFSIVHMKAPGAPQRFTALGHAGIGIAGDDFDFRLLDHLVLPLLGKGSEYRSFDKSLVIPGSYFADFSNWSRLALMRNRRTMDELRRLQRQAANPAAIARLIAVVDNELGYPLYDAIGRAKRALSENEATTFRFSGAGLEIEAEVTRGIFENWIADDLARIEATVDAALVASSVGSGDIDRVFLTGGSSLIPAVREIFARRFGANRVAVGGELTSIARGLALIGQRDDVAEWST